MSTTRFRFLPINRCPTLNWLLTPMRVEVEIWKFKLGDFTTGSISLDSAMVDLLLVFSLGFLGSFGHCASMCGPLTAAFSLSTQSMSAQATEFSKQAQSREQYVWFHLLLNLGRILSYALVGAAIGTIGSVLVASGQMAGIGSGLRRAMALLTGGLLIWFGLRQISPSLLPKLPILHPLSGQWHQSLSQSMVKLSLNRRWWTPFVLGAIWGLIPCGFLYAAQIKAAETGNGWMGGATLLAFGLGTLPMMLGIGITAARVSADRRSQLFQLGGWVTLTIGLLTLMRTGNGMVDYTGHAALFCLGLALLARPMSGLWAGLLPYRRALGVGSFIFSIAHVFHMMEHAWSWNIQALFFMLPQHQRGIWLGVGALMLMTPAALTSFDRAQQRLGKVWRPLHLPTIPALALAASHCILVGSHYLGTRQLTLWNWIGVSGLSLSVLGIFLVRLPWLWSLLRLEKFYVEPKK